MTETTFTDKIAMVLGGGLIVLGIVVFGFFETVLGNPHTLEQTNQAGDVIVHTTFSPNLRAGIIALGLLVWGVYALYKVATAVSKRGGSEASLAGDPTK